MPETLRWWLAATVIGLITVPYAFRLFRFLPDRGLTLARTLGVMLIVYVLWMLSVLGLVPYGAGPAVLLLVLMAAGALILAGHDRRELLDHVRTHLRLLIAAEVIFALVLFGLAVFRAYAPNIEATEKPFEFSLFNGVLHSDRMPPADPWYGAAPISYYYGGYLVTALFAKLTAVPASYAFNLGVVLAGGLAAVSAFGLGANLLLGLSPRRRRLPGPPAFGAVIAAGVLSVVLLMLIGNLEGALEWASARGIGSPAFYQRLGILNFTGLTRTKTWYPDEFWFWWRATRMGSDWNVLEFPFFSFMLGDLHPHLMALPFTLLSLTTIFGLHMAGEPLGLTTLRRQPILVLFLGLLTGMLMLSNTWDVLVYLALLLAVALLLNLGRDGVTWRPAGDALAFAVPVATLGFALYIPFFVHLQAAGGLSLRPIELNHLPPTMTGEGMVLPPHHFLIVWGPLLAVAASGIVAYAYRRQVWRASRDLWLLALGIVLTPSVLWMVAIAGIHASVGAVLDEIDARATWWAFGSYWLVQLGVLALVLIGLVALLAGARRPHPERRASRTYMLLALTAALLLLHAIELFYFREQAQPARQNTLFKFSFIAWIMLATAGGAALVDIARSWWRSRARMGPALWGGAVGAVLLLALAYPVAATMNRTDGFTGTPTLDGLAYLRTLDPNEYDAITWMSANLPGHPMVLEATGDVYGPGGRVSGRTGFPTVIGWKQHEEKLRGGGDYPAEVARVEARAADVDRIYTTTDPAEARDLLQRYGVDYVYVGRLELEKYGTGGLQKFDQLGYPIYRNQSVTVWALNGGEGPGNPQPSAGAR